MKKLSLLVGDLLKNAHDELKFVLGNQSESRHIGLLPLGFGAARARSRRDGALGAGAFTTSFLVVLFEPLVITFIHVVGEAAVDCSVDGIIDGVRRANVVGRILPTVGRVELLSVGDDTGKIGDGDVCIILSRWLLAITSRTLNGRLVSLRGS
jgi:hypothetical protein